MSRHYDGLTGLRGIGALGIVAYHIYLLEGFWGTHPVLDRTVGIGGVFVQLFFILSSFSLMCGYFNKAWCDNFNWEFFYQKRILKLLPTFYFALILHLVLNIWSKTDTSVYSIIGTASLMYVLMPTNQESLVMAGWALGIEVIFYLIFPFFLIINRTKLRTLLTFIVSIMLYCSYIFFYGRGVAHSEINIVMQFLPFAFGAVLFHIVPYLEKMNDRLRRLCGILSQAMLVTCFLLWGSCINGKAVVFLCFGLVIMNQVNYNDLLANNIIFRFLGKISYEIYLFHIRL